MTCPASFAGLVRWLVVISVLHQFLYQCRSSANMKQRGKTRGCPVSKTNKLITGTSYGQGIASLIKLLAIPLNRQKTAASGWL